MILVCPIAVFFFLFPPCCSFIGHLEKYYLNCLIKQICSLVDEILVSLLFLLILNVNICSEVNVRFAVMEGRGDGLCTVNHKARMKAELLRVGPERRKLEHSELSNQVIVI